MAPAPQLPDVLRQARPGDWSPFVNGQTVNRVLTNKLDLVKNDQQSAADALREGAREVNREIAKTLERDPSLRVEYYRLTGKERPE